MHSLYRLYIILNEMICLLFLKRITKNETRTTDLEAFTSYKSIVFEEVLWFSSIDGVMGERRKIFSTDDKKNTWVFS